MTLEQLEQLFAEHGIDYARPEFYNLSAFKAAEAADSTFIENYAEYVLRRPYSPEYVARASETVPRIIQYLFDALVKDGRLGACVDASNGACKILEQYGFWNFVQFGSLTIDYRTPRGIQTRYWAHSVPRGEPERVGHAWLVVPPYHVVDFTVSRQQGRDDLRRSLSPFIMSRERQSGIGVSLNDLVDVEVQRAMLQGMGRLPTIVEYLQGDRVLTKLQRRFAPFAVEDKSATLKFFPCGIGASEEGFAEHLNHCFSGRTTPQVFNDLAAAIGAPRDVGAV